MSEKANEIKKWVIKGDHDLGTAKITYIHIPEYLDTVTFHCQQAVEKAILIAVNVRELITLKMNIVIDHNKIIDK